jgi:hypothetical protein
MPPSSPRGRFLWRGSALVLGMLLIWWFLLLNPLLYLLKGSVQFLGTVFLGGGGPESSFQVSESPAGDWSLRVPLEVQIPASPRNPAPAMAHSVDFDIARADATAFTFSLPVFWAIVLAAPGLRRNLRPLVVGTAVIAVIEVALLFLFVEISAHNVAAQATQSQNAAAGWLRHFGEYMSVSVIPYAAPFLVALTLHGELKALVFGWTGEKDEPAESRLKQESKKRR